MKIPAGNPPAVLSVNPAIEGIHSRVHWQANCHNAGAAFDNRQKSTVIVIFLIGTSVALLPSAINHKQFTKGDAPCL
jgi:hypothetical protein